MTAASGQSIRTLYAAEPPAGSTFVRVVNPNLTAATVAIAQYPQVTIAAGKDIATSYVVVPGGKPFSVSVDGAQIAVPELPAPETFVTVVLNKTGSGYVLRSVVDKVDKSIGLNAELIFYNLAADCIGKLAISDGSVVFGDIASGGSGQRAINPVAASLVASCGDAVAAPLPLPLLKAGDYYSVFLVGEAGAPKSVGALDQTAPFQDSER